MVARGRACRFNGRGDQRPAPQPERSDYRPRNSRHDAPHYRSMCLSKPDIGRFSRCGRYLSQEIVEARGHVGLQLQNPDEGSRATSAHEWTGAREERALVCRSSISSGERSLARNHPRSGKMRKGDLECLAPAQSRDPPERKFHVHEPELRTGPSLTAPSIHGALQGSTNTLFSLAGVAKKQQRICLINSGWTLAPPAA